MIKQILKNIFTVKPTVPVPPKGVPKKSKIFWGVSVEDFLGTPLFYKRSIRIRQVDAGSCNACEWECTALTNPIYDIQRLGIDFVASPRHADVLLVTGPVSRQMELALRKTYLATPEPRLVIACGDCAIDGGIYKGSYAVANGVANVIPVDCYIAGCPPTPMQIMLGIMQLMNIP